MTDSLKLATGLSGLMFIALIVTVVTESPCAFVVFVALGAAAVGAGMIATELHE